MSMLLILRQLTYVRAPLNWLCSERGKDDCKPISKQIVDKGMPISHVRRLFGHAKIDTTLHYAIANQNNVKMSHRKHLG